MWYIFAPRKKLVHLSVSMADGSKFHARDSRCPCLISVFFMEYVAYIDILIMVCWIYLPHSDDFLPCYTKTNQPVSKLDIVSTWIVS